MAIPLPQDYNVPIACTIESMEDFLALIGGKCAAIITQKEQQDSYKVRFNTYAFDELGSNIQLVDRFKFHLEQQTRRKIYENPEIILEEQNYFVIIYMHASDGYRVVAQREEDGSYIFGALASPNYKKQTAS